MFINKYAEYLAMPVCIYGSKTIISGKVPAHVNCPSCGSSYMETGTATKYFTLYYIPLIPYRSSEITQCRSCKKVYQNVDYFRGNNMRSSPSNRGNNMYDESPQTAQNEEAVPKQEHSAGRKCPSCGVMISSDVCKYCNYDTLAAYDEWYNKGNVLSDLERYDEAIDAYDKALEMKKESHEAWNNKGAVLSDLERLDEAINAYDKALELKKDDPVAMSNKGDALIELGRLAEASDVFQLLLEVNPDNTTALYNFARVHALQGNVVETIDCLRYLFVLDRTFTSEIDSDSDFDTIRSEEKFKSFIEKRNRVNP